MTLKGVNRVRKEEWFVFIGEGARPTRANSALMEGGRVRREMVVSVERANLEIRRNFFVIRAANEWNTIPDNVKTQKSLNGFKNAYDACKKNNPIEGAARETIEQEPDPGLT